MQPLEKTKEALTWFCVFPPNENETGKQGIVYKLYTVTFFILSLIFFVSSLLFIWKDSSNNLESTLFALIQVIGFSAIIYTFIATLFLRKKIVAVFTKSSEIYNKSK